VSQARCEPAEVSGAGARGPLRAGERVLAVDGRDRRYLVRLVAGGSFHSHAGVLEHDDVIGRPEGCVVRARRREDAGGQARFYLVMRPTLADIVVKMPRGAQVIYPKDLAVIVMEADIFPGARVLEAGVGSGALSMALLRAGAAVVGYELREDFANRARRNVAESVGPGASYEVHVRDVYAGIDEADLDRVVLDLAEPWRVLEAACSALRPGGIIACYLPTINQTAELREALGRHRFVLASTAEVLRRTWHVEGRSVRPDHRMVAHTGFVTVARLAAQRWAGDATPGAAAAGGTGGIEGGQMPPSAWGPAVSGPRQPAAGAPSGPVSAGEPCSGGDERPPGSGDHSPGADDHPPGAGDHPPGAGEHGSLGGEHGS
jgi:tRNA (adenine57-N1/adenine58-N1)-methyltransferase